MTPTLLALQKDLSRAAAFFSEHPEAQAMPFMHSFPKNSCERCAALLCAALKKKYPDSMVLFVKGRNPANSEMHFWLEIDQFVLDPTAHQFGDFSEPLLCVRPSPLERIFSRESETSDPESETDLPRNSNGKWQTALAALTHHVEG